MRRQHQYAGLVAMLALSVLSRAALAGDFAVEPTQLSLASQGATSELTIANRGRLATRFEAKAFVWQQDEQGLVQLVPTTDVVVYPTLFAIAPGAKRTIRIATTVRPGTTEQAYRVFVQELPPSRINVDEGAPSTIAVLTRIGVPLFLAPIKPSASGAITGTVAARTVRFAIENRGSVHIKVASVRVIGSDNEGHVVIDQSQPAWYVLAGGVRRYELALDASSCSSIAQIAIAATTDRGIWRAGIAMPRDGCEHAP